jgi:hypothetical protein
MLAVGDVDLDAELRMPAVVDDRAFANMGRMNRDSPFRRKISCSSDRMRGVSAPRWCDTILACCELNRVDPVEYLADVLPRLDRGVTLEEARELLPHRWKAARLRPAS